MSVHGGAISQSDAVSAKLIPNVVDKCSLVSDTNNGVCSSDGAIDVIAKIVEHPVTNPVEIIEKAKELTGCSDERCVVDSKLFRKTAGNAVANKELGVNFKVSGPTDTSLLNNYNIDKTLKQWQHKFPDFYAYNFNMRDFKSRGDSLATVDIKEQYNKSFRTFGCVINTDYYRNSGIHWMALFVDMRKHPFTVEFFNSSGNEPLPEYAMWLIDTKNAISELSPDTHIVKCTGVEHQRSKTECGVYSLYYIYARLNNTPAEYFMKTEITDVLCFEFRQHLFHDKKREHVEQFDYKQFEKTSKVKWENDVDPDEIKRITGGANIDVAMKNSRQVVDHKFANFLANLYLLSLHHHVDTVLIQQQHIDIPSHRLLVELFPKHKFIIETTSLIVDIPNNTIIGNVSDINGNYLLIADKSSSSKPVASLISMNSDQHLHGIIFEKPFGDLAIMTLGKDRGAISDETTITKLQSYQHQIDELPFGIDDCDTCGTVMYIVNDYSQRHQRDVIDVLSMIMRRLDVNLVSMSHGLCVNLPKNERAKVIANAFK